MLDVTDDASIEAAVKSLPPLDLVVFAQGIRPAINTRRHDPRARTRNAGNARHRRAHDGQATAAADDAGVRDGADRLDAATKGSYDPSYAAAKGATVSVTKSLAKELRDRVRVNCVAPGLVEDSPVHRSMTPEHAATHARRMFGQRLISAEDVATLILDLAQNRSINGCVIPIDGGYSE